MVNKLKAFVPLSLIVTAMFSAVPAQAQDIPVIPAKIIAEARQAQGGGAPTGTINEGTTLVMTPGVNQVIPVAVNHPNRIVTPFSTPEVVSTTLSGMGPSGECGEICIKENVIYIATDKEHPVTMFITEKDSEAQALSVTMIPRRIPPREVFLKLDDETLFNSAMAYGNAKAEAWEKSQPYLETIRTIFRGLALGSIPQGYTIGKTPRNAKLPHCDHPGLEVDFSKGQFMSGHSVNVFVGVATNVANQPIEFKESWCGSWDVAAAAVWPRNLLLPGEKTEVFVATKQNRGKSSSTKRRSLLD